MSTTYGERKNPVIVKTERQENCIVQLTISVEPDQETEYLRRSARALSQRYRIPGFRPGKAPYNKVVQQLGEDSVRAQVVDQFGDEIFSAGLDQSGLHPIDQASLEEVTWEPLTLHLKVAVAPEVVMGAYREIRVPWTLPEVTEEQVDEELERLRKNQAEWKEETRPAELGDQVVLDIVGKVGEETVLENVDRELVLNADSPYPVPGFAQAVVGAEPNQTQEFDLTYPEDHYNAEIAGQTGHFTVRLKQIRSQVLPALDDEFAMTVGDYENLDDLRAKVRVSLQEQAKQRAERAYEEELWEHLFETVEVEYPAVLVDRELDAMKERLEQQLKQQGLDLESYFRLSNLSEESWKVQARPQAEISLKRSLILAETIQREGLTIESTEIDAEVEEMMAPLGEQAAQLREMFATPQARMSVGESLLMRHAMERLKAIARGEAPAGEPEASVSEADAEKEASPESIIEASESAEVSEVSPPAAEPAPELEANSQEDAGDTAPEEDAPQAE